MSADFTPPPLSSLTPPLQSETGNHSPLSAPSLHPTPLLIFEMIIINLLWAGASVAAKAALTSFGAFSLAFWRFFPAGLILMLYAAISQKGLPKVERRDILGFLSVGFFGIFLTYSLYYTGLKTTKASDASLLNACEPLLISLFAVLFLKERMTRGQWIGMIVGIIGVGLIAGQATGSLIALVGLAIECGGSIVGKHLVGRYPWAFTLGMELLIGSAFLAPFALWETLHHPVLPTPGAMGGLLYLSFACTVFCFGVWYRNLTKFPVSLLAVFILLQPMFGPFAGVYFNHDTLSSRSLWGGLLIAFGIAVSLFAPTFAKRKGG